ncbi:hypothetical protein [Desulfovibrio oxyclinae]|jgi:hypothetical protein|uniref:hypothetical protein n=1 Tax=Desulfovibrio oxyclinae TaxID=63560 RepID=UPI0003692C98|nr:hypothetical protein [Desulfovibrio oxyclinae]
MYRIEQSVSWAGGAILACTASLLAVTWFLHSSPWLLWVGILLPIALYLRYATNQYLEINPADKTITRPRLLFFRETVPDETMTTKTEIVTEDGHNAYLVHVEGSFGKITAKLPGYESYVTMLYSKMAGDLGLA